MNQEFHKQSDQEAVEKEYFIDDHNFKMLIHLQEEIYQATKVKASIKKLANLMVEQVDTQSIAEKLIKQYQ